MKTKKNRFHTNRQSPPPETGPAANTASSASGSSISPGHRRLFRLLAVTIVPLLLLVLLELGLRLAGIGYSPRFFLPAKIDGVGVYIDNQKFTRQFFPPPLVRHPQPSSFTAEKSPQTCRIFVLGESAAMGDPEPAFGMARVMEILLRERFPGLEFEVVNTAVTAINSHVIRAISRDCARYSSDLWVVYMGNNEVVGPFGAGTVFGSQTPPLKLIRCNIALKSLRIGQAAFAAWWRLGGAKSAPKSWGGMEMFLQNQIRPEDPRMSRVYYNFDQNLRDIVTGGLASGARVLVSTVASNLKDCAPFASLHRTDLTPAELTAWEQSVAAGAQREQAGETAQALEHYFQAEKIDADFADLHYRMGRCYYKLDQIDQARAAFLQARDRDALRFRPDRRILDIIKRVAQDKSLAGLAFVDGADVITQHSPRQIAGDELLYEHVHLTFEGSYQLGLALAEKASELLPQAKNQPVKPWLSQEECARRLALTEWDKLQALETMLGRMGEPPFKNQSDWEQRCQRWREQVNKLRPLTKPAALKRYIDLYRQEVARAPKDWYLHGNFAKLLQSANDDKAALEQWQACLKLSPHNAAANYALGNMLDTVGKSAEAQAFFLKALAIRPEFAEALNGLGLCYVNQGKYPEAITCYRQAIAFNTDLAEGHVNLGLVLQKMGKTAEAVAEYETALRIRPQSPSAHINLGKILATQNRLEEALEHYSAAVALRPEDAIAHFNLANALARMNRQQEALEHYALAVKSRPDLVEARLNYGLELARQGQTDQAINQFREAVRLDSNHPDAHYNLGIACAQSRRYEEAIRHFQETLRLEPGNTQALKSLEAAKNLLNKSK